MPPTLANGKICYIEMPATDIARSADFYKRVFGWNIRKPQESRTHRAILLRSVMRERRGVSL